MQQEVNDSCSHKPFYPLNSTEQKFVLKTFSINSLLESEKLCILKVALINFLNHLNVVTRKGN